MKSSRLSRRTGVGLAVLFATWTLAAVHCHGQVTFQQVTNGLIDYYPLNTVLPGNITPDVISRRDLTLVNMTSNNIVTVNHPGIESSSNCLYFNQSGGPTVAYYTTTGQNPFDGSGDFLPFINQRGATMNMWIKTVNLTGNELRLMAECANDGQSSPFFSISDKGSSLGTNASFFLRAQNPVTDPNGGQALFMSDGTYEYPVINYLWNQGANDTTNHVFDGTWHMLTMEISTNGDMHVYVDGNFDPGDQVGGPWTDNEGNLTVAPSMNVTNAYYNTNNYPVLNTTNGSPTLPYVHWLMPDINNSGKTAFGGFIRNNAISGGVVAQMSDIAFWNRALSQGEIIFVMTNGVAPCFDCIAPPAPSILYFSAGFGEVGQGGNVTLSWNVRGASSSPGGIVISGVGDVTALGPVGSTNVTLPANQTYTFRLTVHNGIVADLQSSVSVKVLPGVPSSWNLIQRFDGLFTNTTQGINGNGWVTVQSYYLGNEDRFNVVTVNGNKVLSPESGYVPDSSSSLGFDTAGSVTWGVLNDLAIPPAQENTLFFRFSIHDPGSFANTNTSLGIVSGMDFALGVTDFGFATGPVGGTQPPGGGGTYGPGFHIVRADPNYAPSPFDLTAVDYSGSAVSNTFDYANSVDPNGLMTNVNYMVWLDISNNNTMQNISGGTTNTINEPLYSLWLQKQGDSSRTLLFSGFHGDRDYSTYGQNSDFPTPYLNKVFVSMASEAFQSGQSGAFFETNNMIVLDDLYLSTNGFNGTIPRLFNLSSIVRGANSATITWNSLGSLFQNNTYSVQRTFSLTNPSWTTLTNGLPSGVDTTSFTDNTVGSAHQAFYRISWP